ncbi:MAG: CBU_0592 family membrane protein [Candidatus Paceibacteria bacterium]
MKIFVEIFGWYGMIAIVTAYGLVSFAILQPTDMTYQLLNITGALGLGIVSFYKKAYQPGVLNIIWILIAVVAIGQILA